MEIEKLGLPEEDRESGVGFLQQFSVAETYHIHTHIDFYEVFYVRKGKAVHRVNGESQLLTEGSFVLVRPDDIHQYEFLNTYDMEMISCGFSIDIMEAACAYLQYDSDLFCRPIQSPHIILTGHEFAEIERKLLKIPQEQAGEERRRYFLSILPQQLQYFIEKKNSKTKVIPVWLTKLLIIMNDKEFFVEGLPKMLEAANISQEHLTRELKKHIGLTPTQFINIKRMNYAAELLTQHEHEIVDICYMCGYNNLSYFYEIFKKNYNCSPKEFVEKIR